RAGGERRHDRQAAATPSEEPTPGGRRDPQHHLPLRRRVLAFAFAPYLCLALASQRARRFLGSPLHALSALASLCARVTGLSAVTGLDAIEGKTETSDAARFPLAAITELGAGPNEGSVDAGG